MGNGEFSVKDSIKGNMWVVWTGWAWKKCDAGMRKNWKEKSGKNRVRYSFSFCAWLGQGGWMLFYLVICNQYPAFELPEPAE